MSVKFLVKVYPTAMPAHRYRYTIVNGRNKALSEGYPTHQHVTRAVEGMWKAICVTARSFDPKYMGAAELPEAPYHRDSLKPGVAPKPHQIGEEE